MKDVFLKKVRNYILDNNLVNYGDNVVLGVSGGADSVALLFVMDSLKNEFNLNLKVVHINHGLRKEASSEAEYVRTLAKQKNIPFTLFEYDVKKLAKENGLGTEEMGRKLRYEAFDKALSDMGGKGVICVAHNENDCAETMLFNLFRGTGLKGLGGISPRRGNVIRPLLCVSRDEIEDYLAMLDVKYCTDQSNLTDEYTRNRIRNRIIPLVRQMVCDEAVPHMAEAASQLREAYGFTDRFAEHSFNDCLIKKEYDTVTLDITKLLGYDVYIQKLLVKRMIDSLVPMNKDITHVHIESVLQLLTKQGSHSVNVPYGIRFITSYGLLSAYKEKDNEKHIIEPTELIVDGTTFCDGKKAFETRVFDKPKDFIPSPNQYTKWFDYDKIKQSLSIRTRQSGDCICVNSNGGTKKLKDYFIDEKIPVNERDKIILIAFDKEVVWVVGYRISEACKVTEKTEKILEVTYLGKEGE